MTIINSNNGKRLSYTHHGDKGLNTGGMGAIPVPFVDSVFDEK